MGLLTEYKGTPVIEHTVIAEQTGNQAINIAELIQTHKADFEELGTFSVSNRESSGGRPQKIYNLNEQQATLLMTYLRNTPIVRKFKVTLVKAFYELREKTGLYSISKEAVSNGALANVASAVIETQRHIENTRGHIIEMHDHIIQYLKPKDCSKARASFKGQITRANNKLAKKEKRSLSLKRR